MSSNVLDQLSGKVITPEQLFERVSHNISLLPLVINGMTSSKATIRYGCGKVLMRLSETHPETVYPHMNFFVSLLDSKYRILKWQAIHILAQLTMVDTKKKFDEIFDTYYGLMHDEYMVTVANVVGHSGMIACAKPYLIPRITKELLSVENLKTTPHLTTECKRVISEHAITSFDMFFPQIPTKDTVLSFVKKQTKSPRKSLQKQAQKFLKKWEKNV